MAGAGARVDGGGRCRRRRAEVLDQGDESRRRGQRRGRTLSKPGAVETGGRSRIGVAEPGSSIRAGVREPRLSRRAGEGASAREKRARPGDRRRGRRTQAATGAGTQHGPPTDQRRRTRCLPPARELNGRPAHPIRLYYTPKPLHPDARTSPRHTPTRLNDHRAPRARSPQRWRPRHRPHHAAPSTALQGPRVRMARKVWRERRRHRRRARSRPRTACRH